MNDLVTLVPVNHDNDRLTVRGRELHKALGIGADYRHWFPRMCEYGFSEGADFNSVIFDRVHTEGTREVERSITDHELSIDMAKEICMIQRSERGKMIRQYFLELERQWNNPECTMARALKFADERLRQSQMDNMRYQQIIGELKSRADYTDTILKNKGVVTITQIAKDYGMGGKRMNKLLSERGVQYRQSGQWLLYRKYHDKGYTHSNTIQIVRSDGRDDVVMETKWTQKGRLFIYELLKTDGILPLIECA